jgi:hypothetical protein
VFASAGHNPLRPMKALAPLLLLCAATHLHAQDNNTDAKSDRRPATVSIGMRLGVPEGEFDRVYDREMFGLGGNFSVPFRRLPFEWGIDVAWQRMGSSETTVPIDEEYLDATEAELDVNADIWSYHTFLRLKPLKGRVCPYADLYGGFRTFTARTKIHVDGMGEPLSNERNARDAALSGGWGAGVMVKLDRTVNIEAGFQKLDGGTMTYVDPASIVVSPEGVVGFSTLESTTDVINVHIGIGFNF